MGRRGRPKKFEGKVYVRLPLEVEHWIKQKAVDENRDISEIVRLMLTEWYKAEALNEGTLIIGGPSFGHAPSLEGIVRMLMERVKKIEEHIGMRVDNEEEYPEILEEFGIREVKE